MKLRVAWIQRGVFHNLLRRKFRPMLRVGANWLGANCSIGPNFALKKLASGAGSDDA
jgi:hypothetical protein